MNPSKPLLFLTAADLMTQNVVIVPQEMSLQGAARLLSQAHVSGAPVVDAEGRCVGVLSATDFVHWVEKSAQPPSRQEAAVCTCSWQIVETETLPKEAVRHYMTPDAVTVTLSAPIGELAQMMLDAHIHRVIVVDSDERPIGIISSTDLLAVLAHAARKVQVNAKAARVPAAVG